MTMKIQVKILYENKIILLYENIFDQPAEILSKTDKGELSKQLKFFDGKQNTEFEVRLDH